MMALCLPYYFYVNNMYGEIPSIALMLFSLWMVSRFLNTPSWWSCLLAGLGMAGATAIRKNSVIILIACILIIAILSFKRKIIIIGVLIFASVMGSILPGKIYEYRAHNEMGKGVPPISYIAMGLQWTEGRSPGAWNIYQGSAKDRFMDIMSIHQGIIYFGALLFCILHGIVRRREEMGNSLWQLVLLVSFIGGFLFSILWEGGARYVMPYFVMLIPYAAEAISEMQEITASALTAKQ